MLAEISLGATAVAVALEAGKKCRDTAIAVVSRGTAMRIAGHLGLPANSDTQKTVRRAQLYALQNTLNAFEKAVWEDDTRASSAAIASFVAAAHSVLNDAIGLSVELTLRQDELVVGEIARSLDGALAGATTDRAGAFRRAAEAAVWAEFTAALAAKFDLAHVLARFEPCFRGEEVGVIGWFDGCVAFVGEALKTDDRFVRIFTATHLADLVEGQAAQAELVAALVAKHEAFGTTLDQVVGATTESLARLDRVLDGQRVMHGKLDDAEVAADRRHKEQMLMLGRLAEAKGVPEAPLRAALERLGESGVAAEQIPARLAVMADELVTLRQDLERLRNERPELAAIRARALAYIDVGAFDAAREALREGRNIARAMRKEMSRAEAAFLIDEARVDRLQLNYDAACRQLDEALRLDPDNVWAWGELGELWTLRGSLSNAGQAFVGARDACIRTGDERSLAVSHERVGDVRLAQGQDAEALTDFEAALVIWLRLGRSNPDDVYLRRAPAVSHNKIGEVREAQNQNLAALASFEAALAIRERLAAHDPNNAEWQRDLSISHRRIGGVRFALRQYAAALTSFEAGLAIAKRLAKEDPSNAFLQRDLSL